MTGRRAGLALLAMSLVAAVITALLLVNGGSVEKGLDSARSDGEDAARTIAQAELTDPLASPDPPPGDVGEPQEIGPAGGSADFGAIRVDVPAGAVPDGELIQVAVSRDLVVAGSEIFGPPVQVTHDSDLLRDLKITWSNTGLNELQNDSAVPARWDPDQKVWVLQPSVRLKATKSGLVLRAREFSFWSWIANYGQEVGELTGARTDPPRCSGQPLHNWVRQVVRPDEDTSAASILTCFEPDRDEIVTVRVANNRTFTQQMSLEEPRRRWAWTWPGPERYEISSAVFNAAHYVLDTDSTYLIPPMGEVAVGVSRPTRSRDRITQAATKPSGLTVLVDVSAFAIDQLPIGGLDNPYLEAFLQALYECGGKQSAAAAGSTRAVATTVIDTVGSCASEIMRPNSKYGLLMEKAARKAIRKLPERDAAAVAKSYRLIGEVSRAFKVLTYGKMAFYGMDLTATSSAVGPALWSIRGDPTPQLVGGWTPDCADLASDSTRLYRNIALQDEFADRSMELHEFPGWRRAARKAVKPLAECAPDYRGDLADLLPQEWGDPVAAGVVADAIRRLGSDGPAPAGSGEAALQSLVLGPKGLGPLELGMTPEEAARSGVVTWLPDGCVDKVRGWGGYLENESAFDVKAGFNPILPDYDRPFGVGGGSDAASLVGRIDVFHPAIRTMDGIGVGDSVERLTEVYGSRLREGTGSADLSRVIWVRLGDLDLIFDIVEPNEQRQPGLTQPVIWRISLTASTADHQSTYATDNVVPSCF